jgi:hypothetical protein
MPYVQRAVSARFEKFQLAYDDGTPINDKIYNGRVNAEKALAKFMGLPYIANLDMIWRETSKQKYRRLNMLE